MKPVKETRTLSDGGSPLVVQTTQSLKCSLAYVFTYVHTIVMELRPSTFMSRYGFHGNSI